MIRYLLHAALILLIPALCASSLTETEIESYRAALSGKPNEKLSALAEISRKGKNALPLRESIEKLLADKNEIARQAAIALGEFGNEAEPSLLPLYQRYIITGAPLVKRDMAFSVLAIGKPHEGFTNVFFKDALSPFPFLRKAAILALGVTTSGEDERALNLLRKISAGKHAPDRVYAEAALFALTGDSKIQQELSARLTNPNSFYRSAALESLSRLPLPENPFLSQMVELLQQDPDQYVRAEAAIAIGRIAFQTQYAPALHTPLFKTLETALLEDASYQVRASAALALGHIALPEAKILLEKTAHTEKNGLVREKIAESLLLL